MKTKTIRQVTITRVPYGTNVIGAIVYGIRSDIAVQEEA